MFVLSTGFFFFFFRILFAGLCVVLGNDTQRYGLLELGGYGKVYILLKT